MEKRKIPLCIADLGQEEIDAVTNVIKSGWLAPGNYNKKFEKQFRDLVGVDYAVALNSCTSALHLAVEASGITKNVIVPSFTWVASANSIITGGATPVFADIEEQARALDPRKVEEKIDENTEAIMVVHYGGQMADMDAMMNLAQKYDLVLIEDTAETIGATYKGKQAGSFGIGCFSFFPTKNITTGEGGMLTTNDKELADKVKALSGHGIISSTFEREKKEKPWLRSASLIGYNFRLSNLHAALGYVQMNKLAEMNEKRIQASEYLTEKLAKIPQITPPEVLEDRTHVYQTYSVLVDPIVDRTKLIQYLNEQGIQASVHFDPVVHQQPQFSTGKYDISDLPVTEKVGQQIMTLPMYPGIQRDDLDHIVEHVHKGLESQLSYTKNK